MTYGTLLIPLASNQSTANVAMRQPYPIKPLSSSTSIFALTLTKAIILPLTSMKLNCSYLSHRQLLSIRAMDFMLTTFGKNRLPLPTTTAKKLNSAIIYLSSSLDKKLTERKLTALEICRVSFVLLVLSITSWAKIMLLSVTLSKSTTFVLLQNNSTRN